MQVIFYICNIALNEFKMMDLKFRCNCPITSALDIVGDRWVLVIVKLMLFQGKETFKDFTESNESIATNILSNKLKFMEEIGLVKKSKKPDNKKSIYYHLTQKGLDLAPTVMELALWSNSHLYELNNAIQQNNNIDFINTDKSKFINDIIAHYKKAIFKKDLITI